MRRVAFLFPGQGAQETGMGRDILAADAFARDLCAVASEAARADLLALCIKGPLRALSMTEHLQPAMAVVSMSLARVLIDSGVSPVAAAGHSLGELPALFACRVAGAADVARLAAVRGLHMARAAAARDGTMIAVSGPPVARVREAIGSLEGRGTLAVAAVNAATQVTLSGDRALVDEAGREIARIPNARVTRLNVSGAWHSEHMRPAVAPFEEALGHAPMTPPDRLLVLNRHGREESDVKKIRDFLALQLVSPVRFDLVIKRMVEIGITDFVEIGPGRVLRGLVRLNISDDAISIHNVSDLKSAERAASVLLSADRP